MKKIVVIIWCILILLGSSVGVSALTMDPSMQFIVGNQTYMVNATMVFNQISIDVSFIEFNETGFYLSSPNGITIKLVYINADIPGAENGEKVVDFYTITTSSTVIFRISGFPVNNEYLIKRNGVNHTTSIANVSGFIAFSNAMSSTQRFQIFQQAQAPVDLMPPEIAEITQVASDPLDTDSLFGWVNVSCTVTDNVGISSLMLRILNPNRSWNNVSMKAGTPGKYYYRTSTMFSSVGNYSFSILARDYNSNTVMSSSMLFSMPPNWDVNRDGWITVLDLVFISNQYNQRGGLGWIRQDVDNNGRIEESDLMLVSNHFGQGWWS